MNAKEALKELDQFQSEVKALINLIALQDNAVSRGSDKAPEFIKHLNNEAIKLENKWYEIKVKKAPATDEKQSSFSEDFYRPARIDGRVLEGRQVVSNRFEVEGTIFKGDIQEARERYARLNPSKKWFIWLCDNYQEMGH